MEVNLTPLIDVVFLLLIFFMVSTTFISESIIDISLPVSTSADTKADASAKIELLLRSDGSVSINEQSLGEIDSQKLQLVLATLAEKVEHPVVVISADAEVTHQAVISIMDAARKANLRRVTFRTQEIVPSGK